MAYGDGYAGGYGAPAPTGPPVVTVEWSPTTAPAAPPVWVTIADRFRSFAVTRGRGRELDRVGPGRATLVLGNADRAFDPQHNADVAPMRRVRVRATYGSTTYDVFAGYVRRIRQEYAPPHDAVAVLELVDALAVLAAQGTPGSVYEATVRGHGPLNWWRLGDAAGSTVAVSAGSSATTAAVSGAVEFGAASLPVLEPDGAATFPGAGRLTAPAGGTARPLSVEFWLKTTQKANGWVFHFEGTAPFGEPWGALVTTTGTLRAVEFITGTGPESTTDVADGAPHHVVVTVDGAGVRSVYVDGALQATGAASPVGAVVPPAVVIGDGPHPVTSVDYVGDLDELAVYNRVLTAAEIAAHNDAGRTPWRNDLSGARINRLLDLASFPTADRSVDAGASTLQSAALGGSVLEAVQAVERSEGGLFYITKGGVARFRSRHAGLNLASVATFGDAGVELGYAELAYDRDLDSIANVVRRRREDGTLQEARDTASIAAYYERTSDETGYLNASDDDMRDAASLYLAHYRAPVDRLEPFRIDPQADPPALYPVLLAAELGDAYTVRRRPQATGATIEDLMRLEGYTLTIVPGRWGATWNLSAATPPGPSASGTYAYFQLDRTTGPGLGDLMLAY